jgi:hypothetical protein
MSDWTWEYVPDAANVVGGLTQKQIDEVESLALRIADAVAVRRIGTPRVDERVNLSQDRARRAAPDNGGWSRGVA